MLVIRLIRVLKDTWTPHSGAMKFGLEKNCLALHDPFILQSGPLPVINGVMGVPIGGGKHSGVRLNPRPFTRS